MNQLGPEFPRSCSKRVPWGSGERRPPPGWDETTPKVATAPGDSAQARPELDLLPPGLPPRRRLDHPLHRVPPDYRPRGGGHGRGWETSRGSAGALTRDGTGRARRPSLRHCPGHGRGAGQGRTPHAVPCRPTPCRPSAPYLPPAAAPTARSRRAAAPSRQQLAAPALSRAQLTPPGPALAPALRGRGRGSRAARPF